MNVRGVLDRRRNKHDFFLGLVRNKKNISIKGTQSSVHCLKYSKDFGLLKKENMVTPVFLNFFLLQKYFLSSK